MKKFLLALLSLVIIQGCNNENKYKAPVFKEMGTIKGDTLVRDVLCTDILPINVLDSLLILNCYNALDNKIFYIYDKSTGNLIKTFGQRGNGHGELSGYFETSIDKSNKKIYAIGLGEGWNISFSLDSILHSKTYNCDQKIEEKGEGLRNSRYIRYFKDSLLYSICNFRPQRFYRIAILRPDGDIVTRYSVFPPISNIDKEDTVYRHLFYTYKTLATLKPDASKLVLATTCGLHMEIFSISDNEIKLEAFRRYIKPKYLKVNPIRNDGVIEGVTSLSSTNNYIYALWSKDTEKEFPSQLAVFDWVGNAVRRYDLDSKIWAFAVDEDDSKVYTVVKDKEGKLNIIIYKL
jgi:hypothetical protein